MQKFVFLTKNIPMQEMQLLKRQGYKIFVGGNVFKKGKGAHGLLCLLTDVIDEKVMDVIGPQLKVISNMAAGLDNIDLVAAKKRRIIVTNTPGVLTQAVAEHTVALILGIARRLAEADRFVRAGKFKGWDPELFLGTELRGKVLGLVGHGRIGCRVAAILQQGFQMKALYYDVIRDLQKEEQCGLSYRNLEDLLKEADFVSLHVPLVNSTRHLIGQKELRMMKPCSFLINTSRGQVVDEQSLVHALKEKRVQGAALDVFEQEPRLTPGLAKLENVLLTPHIGSATYETREKMAELAAKNIIEALQNL